MSAVVINFDEVAKLSQFLDKYDYIFALGKSFKILESESEKLGYDFDDSNYGKFKNGIIGQKIEYQIHGWIDNYDKIDKLSQSEHINLILSIFPFGRILFEFYQKRIKYVTINLNLSKSLEMMRRRFLPDDPPNSFVSFEQFQKRYLEIYRHHNFYHLCIQNRI